MIESVLKILGAGLSLWESKEKRKYLDKYLILRKRYYEESLQNPPDDAILDGIELELQLLGEAFAAKVEGPSAKNMPR